MKVLLFGRDGQLGWQLQRSLGAIADVVAPPRVGAKPDGDVQDAVSVNAWIDAVRPDVVVNAAAYTAVDRAEDDEPAAFAVNAGACETLAAASARIGAWLVHYSSDYVYDGSGERPWREGDAPGPLGAYGRSKLAGDEAVARGNPRHLILRTSWVFDSWGNNFARSILKAAQARDALTVVADQWGAPTRAALLADLTAHMLRMACASPAGTALAGTYHAAAAGFTNWHAYAVLVLEEALAHGVRLRATPDRIQPIPSSAYPVRAARPKNSRLDTSKLRETFHLAMPPWQDGVRAVVAELARQHPGSA
jgi:dTDP-4-dehydrorhamnose reductase